MKVGLIANETDAAGRRAVLERYCASQGDGLPEFTLAEEQAFAEPTEAELETWLRGVQVAAISIPPAYTYQVAQRVVRRGVHVFLEWTSMPSLTECKKLAQLAEEAGVEVGVSRPLRFHPLFESLPPDAHASLAAVRVALQQGRPGQFQRNVEDAVDLCCRLSGSGEVRKVEAQVIRGRLAWPDALLAGMRFQNGGYAHLQIRRHVPHPEFSLHAAGPGFEIDVDFREYTGYLSHSDPDENAAAETAFEQRSWPHVDLIEIETKGYLEALGRGAPAPVSLMDGYQVLRLVESIRKNLR
jgi:predicted dehydrogenase